jgi:hypothetical protein
MLWIRKNSTITLGDGSTTYAELYADAVSDLSTVCEGVTLAPGSIALIIDSGEFYVLNSDSQWTNVTNPETGTKSLTMTKTTLSRTEGEENDVVLGDTEIKQEPESK